MRTESQKIAYKKYINSSKGKQAKRRAQEKYYQSTRGKQSRKFYRLKLRFEIIRLLGGKCVNPYGVPHPDWCNDPRCLQIDHVHGGGTKIRKKSLNYDEYYKYILEEIKVGSKDYQLLCANCNWIKKDANNE